MVTRFKSRTDVWTEAIALPPELTQSVNIQNCLPNSVVTASTNACFKAHSTSFYCKFTVSAIRSFCLFCCEVSLPYFVCLSNALDRLYFQFFFRLCVRVCVTICVVKRFTSATRFSPKEWRGIQGRNLANTTERHLR